MDAMCGLKNNKIVLILNHVQFTTMLSNKSVM